MFSHNKDRQLKDQRGFSILEVLITSLIIGIITAIVIVRYGAFNSSVLLKNQAYSIALALREAQVFSLSTAGKNATFRIPYGIFIDLNSGSASGYTLFLDNDEDGSYNTGDTELDSVVIDSRFEISGVCVNSGSYCGATSLSVTFQRPNFDAKFKASGVGVPSSINSATIDLTSTAGTPIVRQVYVNSTGEISVQ